MNDLKKDEDYYIDKDGNFVFTASYLLRRGPCCENGCKNCPYVFKKERNNGDNRKKTNR